ncbi:MAG: HlyD family secretion protein [Syntrophomonadaceae bacterium]|jgi:HlyD family secretion protein
MLSKLDNKKVAVVVLLVLLVSGTLFITGFLARQQAALKTQRDSLTATGTIEAKSVMASFKVSGQIEKLLVDEGSQVQAGQELAILDSREIQAKLAQAQGAYQAAQGQVSQANSALPLTSQTVAAAIEQAQAGVAKAEVGVKNARQKYERAQALFDSGAVSQSQLDDAADAYAGAQHDLQLAQGKLNEALAARLKVQTTQSQYDAALGQSNQALGSVQEAQTYLDNTRLKAPISGFITEKTLEAGEMLNAGTPLFEITDLYHTYVKVFIDEKKIGRVKLGQQAQVRVDAFPHRVFTGKVVWINQAGQFAVKKAVNEQYSHDICSYEVKIDVPNNDLALKTGMTATVTILEKEK